MFITLKLLHMLALLLGGAATLGPIVLQRSLALSGQTTPAPSTPLALRAFGITGLLAILILWITGLMMLSQGYDGASFGIWFAVKMLAATAILLAAITLNFLAARAARNGTPPNPAVFKPLTMLIRWALPIAIIGAVLTFS